MTYTATSSTKLALGSVQFGLDYGISNTTGKVAEAELKQLLKLANKLNITHIDTASSYGESEKILGHCTVQNAFSYLGKISPNCLLENYIAEASNSLHNLNASRFDCVSLHHGDVLFQTDGEKHYQALENLKLQGLTKRIGCSLYSIEEALKVSEKYDIDVVQIPASIFDQRAFDGQALEVLKQRETAVHVRSVFLQGLILMPTSRVPSKLLASKRYILKLEKLAQELKTTKTAIALSPFVTNTLIENIIIGCINRQQLSEVVQAYHAAQNLNLDITSLAINDLDIIDPRRW